MQPKRLGTGRRRRREQRPVGAAMVAAIPSPLLSPERLDALELQRCFRCALKMGAENVFMPDAMLCLRGVDAASSTAAPAMAASGGEELKTRGLVLERAKERRALRTAANCTLCVAHPRAGEERNILFHDTILISFLSGLILTVTDIMPR